MKGVADYMDADLQEALAAYPKAVDIIEGPLMAGMNKVAGDLDGAMRRAREVAAPINAQRFQLKTPCSVNGLCADCKGPDSICAQIVTTRLCKPAGRIKVILVGEDLGF